MKSLHDHLSIGRAVDQLQLRISLIPETRRDFTDPIEQLFASALDALERGDVEHAERALGEVVERDEEGSYPSAALLLRVLRSRHGIRADENASVATESQLRTEWHRGSPLRLVWGSLLELRSTQSGVVFGTLANALFNPEAFDAFVRCVEHPDEPERAAEILHSMHLRTLELRRQYEQDAADVAAWLRDMPIPSDSLRPGTTLLLAATANIYKDFTCDNWLGLSDVGSFEPWLREHLVNRIPRTLAPRWVDLGAMGLFAACRRWDQVLATAVNSTDESAPLYKAVALVERGMPDAAVVVLDERMRRRQKEEPHLVVGDRYDKAWLLLHLGDVAGARRELAKLYASDPEYIDPAGLVEASKARAPAESPGQRRAPIPEEVRHAVWRRDGGRCVECGSNERLEFDHIIPLAAGGSNTERNLQLLCESCNRRKGATI